MPTLHRRLIIDLLMHGIGFQANADSYALGHRIPKVCHLEHTAVLHQFTQGVVKQKGQTATLYNKQRVGNDLQSKNFTFNQMI